MISSTQESPQSVAISTSTGNEKISDNISLLSQEQRSEKERKFGAKDNVKNDMRNWSVNFSVTGSQNSSSTAIMTNIGNDKQQSSNATKSLTAIEDGTNHEDENEEENMNEELCNPPIKIKNPSIISLGSFSLSSRLQKHDDHCRRECRKQMWYNRSKFTKRNDRKDEKKFLELLDEYKQKKFVLKCKCKRTRWHRFNHLWEIITTIFRFIRQFIWCCCCPPILSYCLNKIAFWPPPREYYFFIHDKTKSIGESDREPLTQQYIVRKVNKNCMRRKDWRMGFEHQCATEISGIECFITETEKKNHIACVLVRKSRPRYTLLFSHPNGSDISDHLIGLPNLHDAARFFNCNVCSYDYSGYGISEGKPSEKNMYSDINAVYKYLLEDLCIPETNIILWGYSIGTVASIELAKNASKLAGLILLAPVASIIRTICWSKCCWERSEQCDRLTDCCNDRFNNVKKISQIKTPTLIAHGVQDMIVTIEHGKALYRLCPGAVKPLWIPDVGHNNLENSSMLWRRMRKFINSEARRPSLQRRKRRVLRDDSKNDSNLFRNSIEKSEKKKKFVTINMK